MGCCLFCYCIRCKIGLAQSNRIERYHFCCFVFLFIFVFISCYVICTIMDFVFN